MPQRPSVNNSLHRLRRAGWAASDVAYLSPTGTVVYFVSAHKDKSWVSTGGLTQEEAWDEAAQEAEAIDWL